MIRAMIDRKLYRKPYNESKTLTARERELVSLIAGRCLSSKEASVVMGIATKTAETHRSNVMRKMGWTSVMEMCRWWWTNGGADFFQGS